MKKEIKIEITDDGDLRLDSTGVPGKESEILALLEDLTGSLGGELKVEKHVHRHRVHTGHHVRQR